MAFDYGSIDLGLRNPFKKEGAVTSIRGVLVALMGLYLLLAAAGAVQTDPYKGWVLVAFGIGLLASGVASVSGGVLAMLRYFVGRNHPTSLASNASPSESSTAQEESSYVFYTQKSLIEMVVGRKNATFIEPVGLLARFVHSVIPRLTYMPYPIRNMAQGLFGAWVKTVVALIAYALVAFVTLAGFAGEAGQFIFPVYSITLTIYLFLVWRQAGKAIARDVARSIPSMGGGELVKVISAAIILPVAVGLAASLFSSTTGVPLSEAREFLVYFPSTYTVYYLVAIIVSASACTAIIMLMLHKRLKFANPSVEVSELRENWQESVHPNEIFINLDNLVMANRRYKEVPNRVYKGMEPQLREQVEGKGSFHGEMMQEVQPRVREMNLGEGFIKARLASLVSGNVLFLVASIITLSLAFTFADGLVFIRGVIGAYGIDQLTGEEVLAISGVIEKVLHLVLVAGLVRAFARILANSAHLFFAEIQFESDLIYFKVDGTFTESKISTGAAIHDSTRSENTLVRSSITPWVIVCRLVTTTFASTGMRNLEYPRYIMEMHKNEPELASIRSDVISFLKDRESIASITSARDLENASQIHAINKQSRAIPVQSQEALQKMDDDAAGYLRRAEAEEE
ncbi:hypothetical protein IB286_02815 [Spongiibacter sp. KMU-158]|uniref:Uncharacterized protein n=1 Tax=Spongiibacter pelagi TaxID=2760804 RepID=A0A927BYJ8_9GAMM|nr:hypothetical protein [Spongiibacter pelagi]MBD2857924.1 hypothetical protein [Spongiibacter pelagi]